MRPRPPKRPSSSRPPKDTSWEKVASWYDEHLEGGDDTYQAKVILPNLERILSLTGSERVLDLACGQGFFSRQFAPNARSLSGADLSSSLISHAKGRGGNIAYHVADAADLSFAKDGSFDLVYCVLALQNMERLPAVIAEVGRVLAPSGRFICILNHPAFRIPKRSRWGWDEAEKVQFRRTDAYLSSSKERIDMAPGSARGAHTLSFHRSLQDYMKALRGAGFCVTQLEEWISHKKSQPGPRQKAEDRARKEFPLFLCAEAVKRQ
jgi:ubiquinone/menaquinone biosynthesis C-methylase UbiE